MMKRSSFVMPRARGDVAVIVAIGMLPDFVLRKFAPARRFFYRLGTANQFGSNATRPCNNSFTFVSVSPSGLQPPAHCLMQVKVKRCFLTNTMLLTVRSARLVSEQRLRRVR